MEPKQIIEMLRLESDFFDRNPVDAIKKTEKKLIVGFERWQLRLTREEYDRIQRFITWGCGACCGAGTLIEYQEGNHVVVEGIPCSCHAGWWMSLEIPL